MFGDVRQVSHESRSLKAWTKESLIESRMVSSEIFRHSFFSSRESECIYAGRTTMVNIKFSSFIATSLDGFITREDGSLDWLPGAECRPFAFQKL